MSIDMIGDRAMYYCSVLYTCRERRLDLLRKRKERRRRQGPKTSGLPEQATRRDGRIPQAFRSHPNVGISSGNLVVDQGLARDREIVPSKYLYSLYSVGVNSSTSTSSSGSSSSSSRDRQTTLESSGRSGVHLRVP